MIVPHLSPEPGSGGALSVKLQTLSSQVCTLGLRGKLSWELVGVGLGTCWDVAGAEAGTFSACVLSPYHQAVLPILRCHFPAALQFHSVLILPAWR